MGKIGNYRMSIQESEDYRFGWESAERGEPRPECPEPAPSLASQSAQRMGWDDFHEQESAL